MTDTYIVGFDGTEQAQRAVNFAAARAKQSGAQLHLVQVLEWSPYSFHTPDELAERHKRREEELDRANATVKPIVDALEKSDVKATCEVRHGHAGDLLCEIAAEKKAAQVIIGRTGESALSQRLLGGLAITLVQIAPVPVTIVP
jgi:nucleotide-binding universal stress UspA family protein